MLSVYPIGGENLRENFLQVKFLYFIFAGGFLIRFRRARSSSRTRCLRRPRCRLQKCFRGSEPESSVCARERSVEGERISIKHLKIPRLTTSIDSPLPPPGGLRQGRR